ncbi:MAG: protein-tyrosine phosphatase family protein [Myxococcota bacterium]
MSIKKTTAALIGCFIALTFVGCDHDGRRGHKHGAKGDCNAMDVPESAVDATQEAADLDHREEAPRNFSWVVDNQLAGMGHPGHGETADTRYAYLANRDVSLMVSLTETAPESLSLSSHGIDQVHLPVVDFTAPTLSQLDTFVTTTAAELMKGGRVVVHCAAGQGRTGTFLAAWFVASGATSDEAIDHVRALRPGSIETQTQLDVIAEYATSLL